MARSAPRAYVRLRDDQRKKVKTIHRAAGGRTIIRTTGYAALPDQGYRIFKYPFMKDYYTKLRYNTTFSLASVVGSTAVNVFRLNSLFDPDETNAGHQPRFFDTLCGADTTSAPYGKYRVVSAKIKVQFMNTNSSVTSIGYTGVHIRSDDSAVITSDLYVPELPNTSYKMMNVSTGISNFQKVQRTVSMKKILGVKDMKDAENTAAAYNQSPADVVYADVFYYPRDQSSSPTIYCDCMIEFNIQFFDQNLPVAS